MKAKFVNRAVDVMMLVENGKPITNFPGISPECKVFTLVDNKTGAMIQLDEYMLDFLYDNAKYERERAIS